MDDAGPIYRNPPYKVRHVAMSLAQTMDWGLTFAGVPEAWTHARGRGIKVAVLDTGVDETHADLQGQIAETRDFTGSPFGSRDKQGHGTHCAGIVAGVDNQQGIVGVAPWAQLLAIKVLGDDGSGTGDQIADGIMYAVNRGADILSLSLGSAEPDPRIRSALEFAVRSGRFVVCAAGNDGRPNSVGYPAAWDDLAVCVGAIGPDGKLANYSSMGRQVDCAAPGTDVLSCWPGSRYAKLSGTSMATPFVTACVALLLSSCRANSGPCPKTQGDLIELIHANSDDAGVPGPDTGLGWGLINPNKLLKAVEPKSPAPAPSPSPRGVLGPGEWLLPGGVKLLVPRAA